ncbi:hypothetical protein FXO38_13995 [Capsicum annuum]|nr:hypothetical protein FXO38_13995 [Capsicum annuum]
MEEEGRERKKRKKSGIEKEDLKKAKEYGVQSEQDRQIRFRETATGAGSSKWTSDNAERGSDVAPTIDVPLSVLATTGATTVQIVRTADGTTVKYGVTQSKGQRDDAT